MNKLLPLLLLVSAPALAQQPAAGAPEKCVVEGTVVAAGSNEPLRRARVTLRKDGSRQPALGRFTDAAGRFSFGDVEAGKYRLAVERSGYVRQQYGQRGRSMRWALLELSPGQKVKDLLFRLVAAAVIAGRVYDEQGEALAGVQVQVLRTSYGRAGRMLMPVGGGLTNDLGEYRIFGLTPGRYFLNATYQGGSTSFVGGGRMFVAGDEGGEEVYAPVFYPGTSDPSRAARLELAPGQELRNVDFTLTPARAIRLRGTVLNGGTGQPGRQAQVWLLPRDVDARGAASRSNAFVEDAQGRFEMRAAAPGPYFLTASLTDQGRLYVARQPLEVGGNDIEGLQLVLGPSTEVTGRVRVDGMAPGKLTGLHVQFLPRELVPFFGGGFGGVAEDGTFKVENVAEDLYYVSVGGMAEGFYLKSVRVAGEEVLERGLSVGRGKAPPVLELVLSPSGGSVEGLLLSEEGLPSGGATVVLVPARERRHLLHLFQMETADPLGRFTLRGIPPGEYKLFAWDDIEPGAYLDPEFLAAYEAKGVTVKVAEGGQQSVELKVLPGAPGAN